jgi:hypothetical protein
VDDSPWFSGLNVHQNGEGRTTRRRTTPDPWSGGPIGHDGVMRSTMIGSLFGLGILLLTMAVLRIVFVLVDGDLSELPLAVLTAAALGAMGGLFVRAGIDQRRERARDGEPAP